MSRLRLTLWLLLIALVILQPLTLYAQTDSDGDGIIDGRDRCPREHGNGSGDGCPVATPVPDAPHPPIPSDDRDGDGFSDSEDRCPDAHGGGGQNGCPPVTDRDGDGFADERDACPDVFGGAGSTDGCPLPQDQDGDTVPDNQDRCPASPGLAAFNGCLPSLDPAGVCSLATATNQRVNIRETPALDAAIVGQLLPSQLYPILAQNVIDGAMWYQVENGWVFSEVVRIGGNCADLPPSTEGEQPSAELACEFLRVYTADELARLETAGVTPAEMCAAAEDAPDRVCEQVLANLSPEEMARYIEAGIALGRLCLPEDRVDAPCPLLATLSAEQRARYEAAGINPCGAMACPGVASLSSAETARITAAGLDTSKLCLPPLPADPMCEQIANLSDAERTRYAIAGIDPNTLCTPAQTMNIPGLVVLEVPFVDNPPAQEPEAQMFALQAPANCPSSYTRVKLADSPYTGAVDVVVSGDIYWGTSCREIIFGNTSTNILIGAGGDDILIGYSGDDLLLGGAGDDLLVGMNGADQLNAGSGNDILLGSAGGDAMNGSSGQDVLLQDGTLIGTGGYSEQVIAAWNPWIQVSNKWQFTGESSIGVAPTLLSSFLLDNTALAETAQLDVEVGGSNIMGNGLMRGGSGADYMVGSAQRDLLEGQSGNDWLEDRSFNLNFQVGGTGNDVVIGTGFLDTSDGMQDGVFNLLVWAAEVGLNSTVFHADDLDICFASGMEDFYGVACGNVLFANNIGEAMNLWFNRPE